MMNAELKSLQYEIFVLIKSRIKDADRHGMIVLKLGWIFYLGCLDTLLKKNDLQALKREIDAMKAELTKLESQIQ